MFGLTQDQLDLITLEVVRPLKEMGYQIFCYGSRAREDHKNFSDLDIMIEGVPNSKSEKFLPEARELLTNSNLPFKVDLVFLEHFANSYRSGYEQDKKVWPQA